MFDQFTAKERPADGTGRRKRRRVTLLSLAVVVGSVCSGLVAGPATADSQLSVVVSAADHATEATAFDLGIVSGLTTFQASVACPPAPTSQTTVEVTASTGFVGAAGTATGFVCAAGELTTRGVAFTATATPGTYTSCAYTAASTDGVTSTSIGQPNGQACFRFTVIVDQPPLECPPPSGTRPARAAIQAEAWSDYGGITTYGPCAAIGSFDHGDWMRYDRIDFGPVSPTQVSLLMSTPNAGNTIQVRVGSVNGPIIATLITTSTANGGGWPEAQTVLQTATLTGTVTGVQSVFLTTLSPSEAPYAFGVANIDAFSFA